MAAPKHLNIGVFIPGTVQLLDLSPIDLFGMLDPVYLQACKLPSPLINVGIPSTIHYISVPKSGDHIQLTAAAVIKITKTTRDLGVQTGKPDIFLIPGPDPFAEFGDEELEMRSWRS
jgi:hypothetical protein